MALWSIGHKIDHVTELENRGIVCYGMHDVKREILYIFIFGGEGEFYTGVDSECCQLYGVCLLNGIDSRPTIQLPLLPPLESL
jgi:hypothetical protein